MQTVYSANIWVRYCETDQMGVVNHARYFDWFSEGRIGWLALLGESYSEWEQTGRALPVIEARCVYRSPARFGDELTLKTALIGLRRRELRFGYFLCNGQTLLAEAMTRHCLFSQGQTVAFDSQRIQRFRSLLDPAFAETLGSFA